MKAKEILISGAIVFKKEGNKVKWFVVKNNSGSWEIPKTTVRRGESSVRASIRMTGEQGGMRAKVLEEVGRANGSTLVNGKVVPQRYLYYLMINRGESEVLGFGETDWVDNRKAVSKLETKKEQKFMKLANEMAKEAIKQKRTEPEPELDEELELVEEK